jgi:hypothetical protein
MLLEFPTEITYNAIFVLSSLAERQKGTTTRLLEDLELYAKTHDIFLFAAEPQSAQNFRELMAGIIARMPPGVGALLHLDMHGSIKDGLHIAASNEFIPWAELARLCESVNVHMRNNLVLLLPVCYGQEMLRHVDVMGHAPFNLFIGSPAELDAGFIADHFMPFYRGTVEGGNITTAFDEHLSAKMMMTSSEKIFFVGIGRYFRYRCLGQGGAIRREELLTEALRVVGNNRHNRRATRYKIKAHVRPRPETFVKYASKFLCGKSPGYSFDDVLKMARLK